MSIRLPPGCLFISLFFVFFWVKKSHFLDFFKVVLEFSKCLGFVFGLKWPTFSPLGSHKALKNVDKASPGLFIDFKF